MLAVVGGVWAVGTGLGAAAAVLPVGGVAGIGLGGKAGAAAAPLGAPETAVAMFRLFSLASADCEDRSTPGKSSSTGGKGAGGGVGGAGFLKSLMVLARVRSIRPFIWRSEHMSKEVRLKCIYMTYTHRVHTHLVYNTY